MPREGFEPSTSTFPKIIVSSKLKYERGALPLSYLGTFLYLIKKIKIMPERDEFIDRLKKVLSDKKLPTIEELPGQKELKEEKVVNLEEKITRHLVDAKERARELKNQGLSLKEINDRLRKEEYSPKEIEEAIISLIKEEEEKTEKPKEKKEITPQPKTEENKLQQIPPQKEVPSKEMSIEEKKEVKLPESEFAPLFIKIERYNEVLQCLENINQYSKNIARLFRISEELENIRKDNLMTLFKMFQRLSENTEKLYSGLLKPSSLKVPGLEARVEMEKMDDLIDELKREITILREEIEKIKKL